MVPGINDASADMFAFRREFFTVCGFLDVDGELLVGPVRADGGVSQVQAIRSRAQRLYEPLE